MFKIRSLGLFQPSRAELVEICLLCSLPRVESRGEATWKPLEHTAALSVLWGVLLTEIQSGFVQSVHYYPATRGDLHTAHQPGATALVSLASQLSKCFQPAHFLVFKEVGKEITPERAKNYFSLTVMLQNANALVWLDHLITNCRIPTLIQMSTTNHRLTPSWGSQILRVVLCYVCWVLVLLLVLRLVHLFLNLLSPLIP